METAPAHRLKLISEGKYAGKFEIPENSIIHSSAYAPVQVPLTEATNRVLFENVEYECVAVFTFPISRPGQVNANGRLYGLDLWTKIIARGDGLESPGLMDHPEGNSGGSTKDVWCVWRNIRLSDDKTLVLADAYLVGYWGEEVFKRLKAGMKIGLSSVGYGDFLRDGKTIDPNSYELERVADYVLNPSYKVYGTYEDMHESVSGSRSNLPEKKSVWEIVLPTVSEGAKPMTPRQIREFTLLIEDALARNATIADPRQRKEDLGVVLTYFDEETSGCTDLRSRVEAKMTEADAEVHALIEKGKKLDTVLAEAEIKSETAATRYLETKGKALDLEHQLAETQEKLTAALNLAEDLKRTVDNLREGYLAEKKKNEVSVGLKSYGELRAYTEKARSTINALVQEKTLLTGKLAESEKARELSEGKLNALVEAYKLKEDTKRTIAQTEQEALKAQAKAEEDAFYARVPAPIKEYVSEMLTAYPRFKEHEKALLSAGSLAEVQGAFMKLRRNPR